MRFFKNLFSRPTPGSEVIKETPVDRFNVEIIKNITLDVFTDITQNANLDPDLHETKPDIYEIKDKIMNIAIFYDMMRKTCTIASEKYTPVYFNFQCDGENVGGCAIWIMDLDETRKFAYFYGLHKFPQYFDNRDNFSSYRLLDSVISYCNINEIDFICLPRPCLTATTILWYSIGMTFDIANDKGNYLSYLKREPKQDSYLKKHSSTIADDLSEVYKKAGAINMLEKEITNSNFGPFSTIDIKKGGILYKDNYKKAIAISFKKQKTKDKQD